MQMEQSLKLTAELSAVLVRADGSTKMFHLSSDVDFWKRIWLKFKPYLPGMTLGSFAIWAMLNPQEFLEIGIKLGLVTTAGANYMAADFLASSSNRINAFNQHDCGTGATAAAIGDTVMQTPFGGSRVAGTQSNPSAGQYRTVATISFSGSFAITEWGLFSAASAGTLWDRRVFAAINVASGDSIQFTYTLTVPAGGS